MPTTIKIDPRSLATHVDVGPGGELILRGSFLSTHDGSTIDAATTSWPREAPGGASVDAGGLLDLQAGGFHVTSRDPVTHEVHAVLSGDAAPACAVLGVAAPCLPVRGQPAKTRLLTQDEWAKSLKGSMAVEVIGAPAYAPAVAASREAAPWLAAGGGALALALGAAAALKFWKKQATSPRAQLLALARQVQARARGADPELAAPLVPVLAGALKKLEAGSVDPTSPEGRRVRVMLEKVQSRLEDAAQQAKSQREQQITDELAHEVEVAFAAAEEARAAERG